MTKILKTTVENKINHGYEFRFGDYITGGFEIFQKEWFNFTLYGIVSTFIIGLSSFTLIGLPLLVFPTLLGFSVAADKVENGEKLNFSDFFGAFKNIGQHFIVGLVYALGYLIIFIPYFFLVFGGVFSLFDDSSLFAIFLGSYMFVVIILVLALYLAQVLLFFTPFLIHYGNYSAVEAIKTSVNLSKKNFWWQLLFVIVIGIISGIGQYACIIGIFVSIPIAALMGYSLVKKELMTENKNEIDEIGSHI